MAVSRNFLSPLLLNTGKKQEHGGIDRTDTRPSREPSGLAQRPGDRLPCYPAKGHPLPDRSFPVELLGAWRPHRRFEADNISVTDFMSRIKWTLPRRLAGSAVWVALTGWAAIYLDLISR